MDQKPQLFGNFIFGDFEDIKLAKRCLDSCAKYLDGIYAAITYKDNPPSEDHPLVKLLNKYKANIFYFKWVYDFSAARNFVMDKTPKGSNIYIFWQDCDDILLYGENLRSLLEDAGKYKLAALFFNYLYQVDLDAKGDIREVLIEHKRERIIRNDDTFKWVGRLHEILVEQRSENVSKVLRKECSILHLSTTARIDKNLERNIHILEEQAKAEQHKDPRTILYLAKGYFDRAKFDTDSKDAKINYDLALNLINEYLNGSGTPGAPGYQEGSGWAEERATAWWYMYQIAYLTRKYNIAIKALHNAIIEAPQFPMYYLDMAMVLCEKKDYQKAKVWLNMATSMKEPETTIITTPRDLKTKALEIDYNIAMYEQDLDRAVRNSKMLCEILPNVPALKERLDVVKSIQRANKASQSIVYLGKYLEELKETEKIPYLLQAIPNGLQQERFAAEMRHTFLPTKKWKEDEIAILCGPGFEQWSPKNVTQGIGGSEEAVIYLSQELTKLGYKVTVYGNPMFDAGEHDGVIYRQWYDMNIKDDFNILILWRAIGFVDFNPKARFIGMWAHDVPNNPDFTEERVNKVDKIFVLSEYHKSLFRMFKNGEFVVIPDDKFFLTSNGITEVFVPKEQITRDPYRCIWTSSYDRGLVYLLKMWPDIKKEVPQATLHIFYGWNLFLSFYRNNPSRMRWYEQMRKAMQQEGVTEYGRVPHQQLAEEFLKSGIWSYYSDFQEISCISAMKAQTYGAVPVTTNYAALKETVRNGLRVDGDPYDPKTQEEYKKALIGLLKDHKKQEEIRGNMQKWAGEYFQWSKVAAKWDELFQSNLKINLPKIVEAEKALEGVQNEPVA